MERGLRAGELACPSCGAALAPWGHGRPREGRGYLRSRLFVRPRRSRCSGCQVTHVLLPGAIWPRRADAAEALGAVLEIPAMVWGTVGWPCVWAGPRARLAAGSAASREGPRTLASTSRSYGSTLSALLVSAQ
ncbi:DUF6431 domain-containing protein [Streptomyces sp. NPDC055134]